MNGRGAWTTVGMNGTIYYEVTTPNQGSQPTLDFNYKAVNLAILAMQKRVNVLGYTPKLVEDGELGPKSQLGFKWFQTAQKLTVDGQFGPTSVKRLFGPIADAAQVKYSIPSNYLKGLAYQESNADPGAVGYLTTDDRGLVQLNLKSAPVATTEAQAFDPSFAFDAAGRVFRLRYDGDSSRGIIAFKDWRYVIAAWNSPALALKWYQTGNPPFVPGRAVQIEDYVNRVINYAATITW